MKLTGKQREQLHRALLSAFPNRGDLQRMINFKLDVNLEEIAGGQTQSEMVFSLIGWAEARGRLEDLMLGARESNPGSPALAAAVSEILESAKTPVSSVPSGQTGSTVEAPGKQVNKAALRKAMAGAFDSQELEQLATDVQDALEQSGIDLRVSLDAVGGTGQGLETQVLNLVTYLERRGHLDVLAEAVRRARPALRI